MPPTSSTSPKRKYFEVGEQPLEAITIFWTFIFLQLRIKFGIDSCDHLPQTERCQDALMGKMGQHYRRNGPQVVN